MELARLYSHPIKPDLPQCAAMRQTPYANDTSTTDKRCKWRAVYNIGGQFLCTKHAGQEALKILFADEATAPKGGAA